MGLKSVFDNWESRGIGWNWLALSDDFWSRICCIAALRVCDCFLARPTLVLGLIQSIAHVSAALEVGRDFEGLEGTGRSTRVTYSCLGSAAWSAEEPLLGLMLVLDTFFLVRQVIATVRDEYHIDIIVMTSKMIIRYSSLPWPEAPEIVCEIAHTCSATTHTSAK